MVAAFVPWISSPTRADDIKLFRKFQDRVLGAQQTWPDLASSLDAVYLLCSDNNQVPAGLAFLGCESLGTPDHETSGYIATYRVDYREVAVVFLIADLHVPGRDSTTVAARAAHLVRAASRQAV